MKWQLERKIQNQLKINLTNTKNSKIQLKNVLESNKTGS